MILSTASKHLMTKQALFVASSATTLVTTGIVFRDLADLSQWVLDTDRNVVFQTHRHRHVLAVASVASMALNTAVTFQKPRSPRLVPIWGAINGVSAAMLYSGYVNPSLMMRPRNQNPVYVPANKALSLIKREEPVIVTQIGDGKVMAFPDSQVLRPHVARAGRAESGNPVIMTYCGLSNLGIVYETPNHLDGSEVELEPITQLENNLVLADKKTGHVGQQINGFDETAVVQKLGKKGSYHDTKRKPANLDELKLEQSQMGKEVPTWRMTLGNFVRTYPSGEVFINDYKTLKDWKKRPIQSIYDTLMDTIFDISVYIQATSPSPVFPTLKNIDPRLPPKEQVWAFDIDNDYVAVTEKFVRDGPNGVRNMTVGSMPLVAAWDAETASIGIWKRTSNALVTEAVDVFGKIKSSPEQTSFERVNTVKNGAFWCVWANFFPQTRVNPTS